MWQNFSFEAHRQQRLQTHFRQATAFSLFGLHDELTIDSIHFKPQTSRAENQGSALVHSAITVALEPYCQAFVLNPGHQNQLSTDIRRLGKMLTLLLKFNFG